MLQNLKHDNTFIKIIILNINWGRRWQKSCIIMEHQNKWTRLKYIFSVNIEGILLLFKGISTRSNLSSSVAFNEKKRTFIVYPW